MHQQARCILSPAGPRGCSFPAQPGKIEEKPLGLVPHLSSCCLVGRRGRWLGNPFFRETCCIQHPALLLPLWVGPKGKPNHEDSPWRFWSLRGFLFCATSYHSSLPPVAHDSLSPASGTFSLSPVLFHGPAPSNHPLPSSAEELAGSSDTSGLSSNPRSAT